MLYTTSHDQAIEACKLSDGTCVNSFLAHDDGPVNTMLINEANYYLFTSSVVYDIAM
jgi:COMPASS component SWD3